MAKVENQENHVDIVYKWMGPEEGYVKFSPADPDAKKLLNETLLINISRKRKRVKK